MLNWLLRFALVATVLWPVAASAAVTVLVRTWPNNICAFSRASGSNWAINDYVCFRPLSSPGEEPADYTACGQVLRVTDRGLIVSLSGVEGALKPGARLDMQKVTSEEYRSTGLLPAEYRHAGNFFEQRSVGVGAMLTAPFVLIEQGIFENLSLGYMPVYISRNAGLGKINGLSNVALANIYLNRLFHGPWFFAGVGWYLFTAEAGGKADSTRSMHLMGGVGWRYLFHRAGINLGIAAGTNYFTSPTSTIINLGWDGFIPFAALVVAIRF